MAARQLGASDFNNFDSVSQTSLSNLLISATILNYLKITNTFIFIIKLVTTFNVSLRFVLIVISTSKKMEGK